MKISVLGTGCQKCHKLEELARKVVSENNIKAEVEKVSEIKKIMEFGVMMTPALAIDGKVVLAGKVPSEQEIKKLLGA